MPEFNGFRPEDFDGLDGSTWRSRKTLGGVLARHLREQLGQPYQSWGVRRRLELHIAHADKYDFYDPFPFAKLFVYSDGELAFGFYLETPAATGDVERYVHWQRFRDRLGTNSAMRTKLLAAMLKHDLTMTDYYLQETGGALGCHFAFREGRLHWWRPVRPAWEAVDADHLVQRLSKLPEDRWVDLHVFARMDQQAAMDLGVGVVGPILAVLRDLAPLYEMTIAN